MSGTASWTERQGSEGKILGEGAIRESLRRYLHEIWTDHPDTVLVDELGLCRGQVRVDVAAVNGVLHGYEIKSDRDRLTRLPTQVQIYGEVVDRATIVVGTRYLDAAREELPAWWGILLAEFENDAVRFDPVRGEAPNPTQNPRALVELLWREEALAMLEEHGWDRGVRSKPRPAIWDRVCECFDVEEIAAVVRQRLRFRATTPDPPQFG